MPYYVMVQEPIMDATQWKNKLSDWGCPDPNTVRSKSGSDQVIVKLDGGVTPSSKPVAGPFHTGREVLEWMDGQGGWYS